MSLGQRSVGKVLQQDQSSHHYARKSRYEFITPAPVNHLHLDPNNQRSKVINNNIDSSTHGKCFTIIVGVNNNNNNNMVKTFIASRKAQNKNQKP